MKAHVATGSPHRDRAVSAALIIDNKAGLQRIYDCVKGGFMAARKVAGQNCGCGPGLGPNAAYMIGGDVFVLPKSRDPTMIRAQRPFAKAAAIGI